MINIILHLAEANRIAQTVALLGCKNAAFLRSLLLITELCEKLLKRIRYFLAKTWTTLWQKLKNSIKKNDSVRKTKKNG
ncbi:MAG: hypothetical protein DRH15_14335, partial [Deltaproteobacteria bacterium]